MPLSSPCPATKIQDDVIGYVVDIIRATRTSPALETGASPRAAAALATAARARAALDGRDFVIPDDVKVAGPADPSPPRPAFACSRD
jgi:MoxR-like ATPase